MIDVAYGDIGFCATKAHRFEEQKRCCSGSVLGEGLVDTDADGAASGQGSVNNMFFEYFVSKCLCHNISIKL